MSWPEGLATSLSRCNLDRFRTRDIGLRLDLVEPAMSCGDLISLPAFGRDVGAGLGGELGDLVGGALHVGLADAKPLRSRSTDG